MWGGGTQATKEEGDGDGRLLKSDLLPELVEPTEVGALVHRPDNRAHSSGSRHLSLILISN